MQLELPHINVLSKIDLLASYGELRESASNQTGKRKLNRS